ncbi:hypothetical protein KBB05_04785 [Patescibacteria group bacterium]|nr:hypothetical protein [Patescibacteria group bacterium]
MDQLLLVAKNISTLLLPLVLILLILISFLVFKLLLTINKTAGAVKETTFMVNSIVQNSV